MELQLTQHERDVLKLLVKDAIVHFEDWTMYFPDKELPVLRDLFKKINHEI